MDPQRYERTNTKMLWILFVVEEKERNIGDQRCLESELFDSHGLRTIRASFQQLQEILQVDPHSKVLRVQGKEIGIVYYRTGYQIE